MPAENPARPWTIAIALMLLAVVATLWFPLLNIAALPSNNYNEGWNAYRQWMTVLGQPLYAQPPALWTTNYPFLSFHIVGLLAGTRDNLVLAGRILCLLSFIATATLMGAIVRLLTLSRPAAVYTALALLAWFASFYEGGRASNDPELLSVAMTSFGLFAYLKGARQLAWVSLSALAFAASLFTKHDLIAFPLSICIHLLITRNGRATVVFVGTGIVAAALLLAATFQVDGPYFFTALLQPRAYSLDNLRYETLHYLLHFLVPLLVGLVLLLRDRTTPYRSLLLALLLTTHAAGIYFAGGDGVGSNIFFPAIIADLLTCLVTISRLAAAAAQVGAAQARAGRGFRRALALVTLACLVMVPSRLRYDLIAQQRLPSATQSAQQAIARLAAAQGPAICEDLLLCFEAGKPIDYDPYYVEDQVLTGRIRESDILGMLAAHHYAAIQIDGMIDAASVGQRGDKRFSQPFLHTLLADYQPVLATPLYSVFVPRR